MDEIDKIMVPLGKYATLKERRNRVRHPRSGGKVIEYIFGRNTEPQLIMLSATVSQVLKREIFKYYQWDRGIAPVYIQIGQINKPINTLRHMFIKTARNNKVLFLFKLYKLIVGNRPCIAIFSKSDTDKAYPMDLRSLKERLENMGVVVADLYDTIQAPENRAELLEQVKRGEVNMVLANSDSIRGLHFENINYVFLMDVPRVPSDYIHHAGRTGRQGNKGIVISLANHSEIRRIRMLSKFLHIRFRIIEIKEDKNITVSMYNIEDHDPDEPVYEHKTKDIDTDNKYTTTNDQVKTNTYNSKSYKDKREK